MDQPIDVETIDHQARRAVHLLAGSVMLMETGYGIVMPIFAKTAMTSSGSVWHSGWDPGVPFTHPGCAWWAQPEAKYGAARQRSQWSSWISRDELACIIEYILRTETFGQDLST
jgi:hypothetical protein